MYFKFISPLNILIVLVSFFPFKLKWFNMNLSNLKKKKSVCKECQLGRSISWWLKVQESESPWL